MANAMFPQCEWITLDYEEAGQDRAGGYVASLPSEEQDAVAGAVPLGGSRGGPIFKLAGEVVGVLTSVSWTLEEDGVSHEILGAAAPDFAQALAS